MEKRILAGLLAVMVGAFALTSCIGKKTTPDNTSESTIDHLIIEEVFTVGTFLKEIPAWKQGQKPTLQPYDKANEQYIKIYNPTKEVKYLDGMGIAISVFHSDAPESISKADLKIKEEVLGSSMILQFPGNGTQYAIQPGHSVLVAGQAIDHTAGGTEEDEDFDVPQKALDLSGAMFQMIPEKKWSKDYTFKKKGTPADMTLLYSSEIDEDGDEENVDIKLPLQGMIALVDLKDATRVTQLKGEESTWNITIEQTNNKHTHRRSMVAKKVPNSWIVDAVNICPENSIAWQVASATLDGGAKSTLATPVNSNNKFTKEDFSKSIRRKHNGKTFVDTNNSTVDFEVGAPSLLKMEDKKGEGKKAEGNQ